MQLLRRTAAAGVAILAGFAVPASGATARLDRTRTGTAISVACESAWDKTMAVNASFSGIGPSDPADRWAAFLSAHMRVLDQLVADLASLKPRAGADGGLVERLRRVVLYDREILASAITAARNGSTAGAMAALRSMSRPQKAALQAAMESYGYVGCVVMNGGVRPNVAPVPSIANAAPPAAARPSVVVATPPNPQLFPPLPGRTYEAAKVEVRLDVTLSRSDFEQTFDEFDAQRVVGSDRVELASIAVISLRSPRPAGADARLLEAPPEARITFQPEEIVNGFRVRIGTAPGADKARALGSNVLVEVSTPPTPGQSAARSILMEYLAAKPTPSCNGRRVDQARPEFRPEGSAAKRRRNQR